MTLHTIQFDFGDWLFGLTGQVHFNLLIKGLVLTARVANGVPSEFVSILYFVKHGSPGDVKDDGSHGKEGGEIGYRRQISYNGRQLSYRLSLAAPPLAH